MKTISDALRAYMQAHLFDSGDPDRHENNQPEIQAGFAKLETFLETLPLDDNNAVFYLRFRLCIAYECKAFLDGLQYGARRMQEI